MMQTIQVRYQYYPGGVSTWTATSNNPPEGKTSSASGNGYTYSDAETRQAAIGNAGYFGYGSEDTIYVNGEVYQAGRQVTPTPQSKLCCPSGWTYDGNFCMSQSGEEVDPPHDCSLFGGVYVEDAPAPPIPYVRPPYQPPPIVEPPYQPPGACPRGNSYPTWGLAISCDEGYDIIGGVLNRTCICSSLTPEQKYEEAPEAVQEFYETPKGVEEKAAPGSPKEIGLDMGLGEIIKMLPQLLIVMVIVSIIGAFRK